MAESWYVVKCWLSISPDGVDKVIGTRPTHSWVWEMWTVDRKDGTTAQIPQRLRPKYQFSMSMAYDKEYVEGDESTFPTVALLLVEHPDGTQSPLEPVDYEAILNTPAKWNALYTQYPELKYRFLNQPYFPAP